MRRPLKAPGRSSIGYVVIWTWNGRGSTSSFKALGKTKYAEADLAEAIRRDPTLADEAERKARLPGRPMID